ncbi:MAG: DNA replication/repair protein RecF [Candidatus Daviesbacteria bacterium]|nr:DNA replication/repair protein RecF [Candidatus Daviesbacteria bacterium]
MLLKHLKLTNFRNYTELDLTFSETPTIFIGPNGAGKSNILEAVYLLATTKSPRVENEFELIKEESGVALVTAVAESENNQTELQVTMADGAEETTRFSKRVKVNGVPRKVVDFIGNLPAVIFWPSDINMVTGSPSLRRWHLDLSLAQIFPNYKKSLTLYEQVLYSRNRVLKRIKEGFGKMDELDYWTDELIKYGEIVTKHRVEFFDFINKFESALGNFRFEFKCSEVSKDRLTETNGREVAACNTLIGPHRDDFKLYLEKRDMAKFGSRGEQRMATLAFKLATLEYMAKILGKRPILLLDDVFSELDANHRAQVAEIAKLQQTIIATVELENIPQEFLDSSRILKVEDGKII